MDYKVQSLIRRGIREAASKKSVDDPNMITGTWYFKFKIKSDGTMRKSKAHYCVRGGFHKILYP